MKDEGLQLYGRIALAVMAVERAQPTPLSTRCLQLALKSGQVFVG